MFRNYLTHLNNKRGGQRRTHCRQENSDISLKYLKGVEDGLTKWRIHL